MSIPSLNGLGPTAVLENGAHSHDSSSTLMAIQDLKTELQNMRQEVKQNTSMLEKLKDSVDNNIGNHNILLSTVNKNVVISIKNQDIVDGRLRQLESK